VMIVVTWCGAVGRVQLAGGEETLAPSSKAGPQPVWVVVVTSTKGHGFGLAYKVTDFVRRSVVA
jgi:hypothetical protein